MTSHGAKENEGPPAKFTKLIIHKFPDFRHVELNFNETLTLVNGAKLPAEGEMRALRIYKHN